MTEDQKQENAAPGGPDTKQQISETAQARTGDGGPALSETGENADGAETIGKDLRPEQKLAAEAHQVVAKTGDGGPSTSAASEWGAVRHEAGGPLGAGLRNVLATSGDGAMSIAEQTSTSDYMTDPVGKLHARIGAAAGDADDETPFDLAGKAVQLFLQRKNCTIVTDDPQAMYKQLDTIFKRESLVVERGEDGYLNGAIKLQCKNFNLMGSDGRMAPEHLTFLLLDPQ